MSEPSKHPVPLSSIFNYDATPSTPQDTHSVRHAPDDHRSYSMAPGDPPLEDMEDEMTLPPMDGTHSPIANSELDDSMTYQTPWHRRGRYRFSSQRDAAAFQTPRPASSLPSSRATASSTQVHHLFDRQDTVASKLGLHTSDTPEFEEKRPRKLVNTFKGVYVPTCEMMWGVIIFVRFGYVVGEAGVGLALLAAILSALCVMLTVMSLSAIATNGISKGGTFYLLTKTLGPALGGSISIIFYLGVTILSTVELAGFAEAVVHIFEDSHVQFTHSEYWDQVVMSLFAIFLMISFVLIGIRFVQNIGIFFMAALFLAFLACVAGIFAAPQTAALRAAGVTGLSGRTLARNFGPHFEPGMGFHNIMALVFPCFIGIMVGVNQADLLRNPYKSIPRGAFSAIATSFSFYTLLFFLLGAFATYELLISNRVLLINVSWPTRWLGMVGVIFVGFGSGLQCLVVAQKMLHAIARAKIVPVLDYLHLDRLWGGEPRKAALLTFLIALPFVFVKELDTIATVVTMCFLQCYAFTNMACFIFSILRVPSWRPKYRWYHWSTALLGFIFCVVIMFMINYLAAIASLIASALLALYIQWAQDVKDWGEGFKGLQLHLALNGLLSVELNERQRTLQQVEREERLVKDAHGVVDPPKREPRRRCQRGVRRWRRRKEERNKRGEEGETQEEGEEGGEERDDEESEFGTRFRDMDRDTMDTLTDTDISDDDDDDEEEEEENVQQQTETETANTAVEGAYREALRGARRKALVESERVTRIWRPHYLCFVDVHEESVVQVRLLSLLRQLKASRGLCLVCHVMARPTSNDVIDEESANEKRVSYSEWANESAQRRLTIQEGMVAENLHGFAYVVNAASMVEGISVIVQTAGLASLTPNTVLACWPSDWQGSSDLSHGVVDLMKRIRAFKKSAVFIKNWQNFPERKTVLRGTIDIWWIVHEGGLLMLLAVLLKKSKTWKRCLLRIFTVAELTDNSVEIERQIKAYLYQLRIQAQVEVIEMQTNQFAYYTNEWTVLKEDRMAFVDPLNPRREGFFPSLIDELQGVKHASRAERSARQSMANIQALDTDTEASTTGTTMHLQKAIYENSKDADLVIMNTPVPSVDHLSMPQEYMELIEFLTDRLHRVMLVSGCGQEVINID